MHVLLALPSFLCHTLSSASLSFLWSVFFFFFNFYFIHFFIFIFGCAGSSLLHGLFSSSGEQQTEKVCSGGDVQDQVEPGLNTYSELSVRIGS